MANIVIMGASSGIGMGVAEALASRGVKVGLAARHTASLLALKQKYPDCVEYASIDITHADAPKRLNELAGKIGGMDIYLHCSGIGTLNPDLDPALEVEVVQTNATGFARMMAAAFDYFRDNKRPGRIAGITSVAGTKGIGKLSAYSASKAFDSAYIQALAQRAFVEKLPLKLIDIRPGWIRTPLVEPDKKYPMEMTVDQAVPYILRALVKAPRVAYVGIKWELLYRAWALLPDCIWERTNPKNMV